MTKVIMHGCNGRMGRMISDLIAADADIEIVAGVDAVCETPNSYPVYKSISECKEKADAVIDFSTASIIDGLLDWCVAEQVPCVLCTTGLSEEQLQHVSEASKKVAVLKSANMSLGVNLLIQLAKKATALLEDSFDIEIIEKHHNLKIDAPSGTALAIADAINETCASSNEYVYDRHSTRKKRSKNEIGIHSLRGGTIVGEHSVIYAGTDEIIELKHTATSKEIFAVGSIKAARFLYGKAPALYSMDDLISEIC